jgi:hypothetical protein
MMWYNNLMDTEHIKNTIRTRFNHNRNKQILKEKYEAKMLFASQGGMWRADQHLLSTLLSCPEDEAIIIDEYETPIQINTKELFKKVQMHWQEQMNGWLVEFNSSSRQR